MPDSKTLIECYIAQATSIVIEKYERDLLKIRESEEGPENEDPVRLRFLELVFDFDHSFLLKTKIFINLIKSFENESDKQS